MKVDADEFMKTHSVRKRVSILEPFRDEIFKLKNAGYSIRHIVEFLALNNVVISQNALNSFIKVRQKTEPTKGEKVSKPFKITDSSAKLSGKVLASESENSYPSPAIDLEKKRELVEINGRIIDVNYKPSWVDEDINLKDLL